MRDLRDFLLRLQHASAVLVTVTETRGSVPRERGAWMAVFADACVGTIGGGHLEWQAITAARAQLAQGHRGTHTQRQALGPSLGQCCGGVVQLGFESVDATDIEAIRARLAGAGVPLALFGGGHVGSAIVRLAAELPLDVTWIDSRDEVFPTDAPAHVRCEHSSPVQAAVADLAPGSRVLIMSFSHAEDLDILAACLDRQRLRGDLGFIGLIGSRTKWATFRRRLTERGYSVQEMAAVTCPIGLPGIAGKQPGVIALAALAQLMQQPA